MDPVALFGYTSDEFTDAIIHLREQVRKLGYEEKAEELYTVPHLTLTINRNFDVRGALAVKQIMTEKIKLLHPFTLHIQNCVVMDRNIAVTFDNTYSSKVAKDLSDQLKNQGFEIVITDHMRLIRSVVKEDKLEEVSQLVVQALPQQIEIIGIALAGKLLRKEDILWNMPF